MLPVTFAIPVLFIAGVAFGYLVVLPAALHFFQNFNSSQFNVLVQASQYYKFAATTLLAMGLLFQIPVAIIAVTRAGLVTPKQLRHNRRYAVLACGLVAAVLPGDAITMLLETCPCTCCSSSASWSRASPSDAPHADGPIPAGQRRCRPRPLRMIGTMAPTQSKAPAAHGAVVAERVRCGHEISLVETSPAHTADHECCQPSDSSD